MVAGCAMGARATTTMSYTCSFSSAMSDLCTQGICEGAIEFVPSQPFSMLTPRRAMLIDPL